VEAEMNGEHLKAVNPNARHKEEEHQYLRSFRYLCNDFPDGHLQDHERPDFVLVTAQRKIGIELTRVFKSGGGTQSSQQSIEATKDEIVVAARTYSECLNSPPAHVSLFFSLQRPLPSKARQKIARRVAQVVHDNMPPEGKSVRLDCGAGGPRNQPIEVDLILINRVHPVDRPRWGWIEMGAIQMNAIELLEAAIKEKAQRLDDYLRRCDECWLLIVAPSFKPSGKIHPDEHSLSHTYASPFSRTYFLDFGHGSLFRLQDQRGGAHAL
jgi:hypothetical protein